MSDPSDDDEPGVKFDVEDGGSSDPVEQFDPAMRAVQAEPWFREAVSLVDRASSLLVANGIDKGALCVGCARLCLDDPLAGALVEVAALPWEGLSFLRLGVPDPSALLDFSRPVHDLAERLRQANPDAYLLVLPHDWSFRVMEPEMARQFAVNMLAFVSDAELEKIGLKRIEAA